MDSQWSRFTKFLLNKLDSRPRVKDIIYPKWLMSNPNNILSYEKKRYLVVR